jgi:hypothetical protein
LHQNIYAYAGAEITPIQKSQLVSIKLMLSHCDLKRFQDISSSLTFLVNKESKEVISLNQVPQDETGSTLFAKTTEPIEQ